MVLGPLYHLIERSDRILALREARRILRPAGVVVAAAISRYAGTIDGLILNPSLDSDIVRMRHRALADGHSSRCACATRSDSAAHMAGVVELRLPIYDLRF